jgi:hypothetical protein
MVDDMKRQMLSAIGVISAVLALQNSAFAATIDPFLQARTLWWTSVLSPDFLRNTAD